MSDAETIDQYNSRVSEFVGKYEALSFESINSDVLDLIPNMPGLALDVGAGSGRDAAWFARKGWDIVALDAAAKMLEQASINHPEPQIRWEHDRLPGLERISRRGLSFDLIWINAVWMHLSPADRERAFRKLVYLLKPAGWIFISLRHGDFVDGRKAYPVRVEEIERLAHRHGLRVHRTCKSTDRMARTGVSWDWVCMQLPDDGTEALPLLRHTILRDDKSSTYKLALVRVLVRIADSALGIARDVDDETVAVPLGLVALYWLRMYKPLVENGILQAPLNKKETGLGFVKEAFKNLESYSAYDLRVGQRFSGGNARWLVQALIDARNTIKDMPAFYIKYPNSSEQVFKTIASGRLNRTENFVLNAEFLWAFGELRIPRYLWRAMFRFASWIEPSLITEWIRMMQGYAEKVGKVLSYDELIKYLTWIDPERDTLVVREITQRMLAAGEQVYCVWSGKKLQTDRCDVDHCFPFSAWPCADLWNLMPASRTLNQHEKRDKLVSAATLHHSVERIMDWWSRAYANPDNLAVHDRFITEARVTLPISFSSDANQLDEIFEGMLLKRIALKRDLQLVDWNYSV